MEDRRARARLELVRDDAVEQEWEGFGITGHEEFEWGRHDEKDPIRWVGRLEAGWAARLGGDGDGAAHDLAAVEPVVALGDVVEGDLLDLDRQVSAERERDDLEQLATRAPVGDGDRGLKRQPPKPIGYVPPPTPTTMTSAPTAATAAASRSVSFTPTKSKTTVAPRGAGVSAITASAIPSPPAIVASAPARAASASASSRRSTAMTRETVSARSICTATCPRPPTPITTAVEPGTKLGQRPLDDVVGSERRVGQRGCDHRIQIADRDQQALRGHEHVSARPPSRPRPPP